jgi:hypothetical protein
MPAAHGRVKKVLSAVKRCDELEAALKVGAVQVEFS